MSARHRAALALVAAEIARPGDLAASAVAVLHRHFSRAELLELTLDVMKWSYQKVSVALGTDDEVRPGELSDLAFDADGHPIR